MTEKVALTLLVLGSMRSSVAWRSFVLLSVSCSRKEKPLPAVHVSPECPLQPRPKISSFATDGVTLPEESVVESPVEDATLSKGVPVATPVYSCAEIVPAALEVIALPPLPL
jgi:hypothetical protein